MNTIIQDVRTPRTRRSEFRSSMAYRPMTKVNHERRHGAPVPLPLTRRQLMLIALAWCAVMGATMWLCTDAGMRFLVALWGAS